MKLAEYVEKYTVNLSALAKKIGCSQGYLFDIKNGRRNPPLEMRKKIFEATFKQVTDKDYDGPPSRRSRRKKNSIQPIDDQAEPPYGAQMFKKRLF